MSLNVTCVAGCGVQPAVECLQTCYPQSTSDDLGPVPAAAAIPLAAVLVLLSGLFSGLNLGLLSLDLVQLKVGHACRVLAAGAATPSSSTQGPCMAADAGRHGPRQGRGEGPAPASLTSSHLRPMSQVVEQSGDEDERKYARRLLRGELASLWAVNRRQMGAASRVAVMRDGPASAAPLPSLLLPTLPTLYLLGLPAVCFGPLPVCSGPLLLLLKDPPLPCPALPAPSLPARRCPAQCATAATCCCAPCFWATR